MVQKRTFSVGFGQQPPFFLPNFLPSEVKISLVFILG